MDGLIYGSICAECFFLLHYNQRRESCAEWVGGAGMVVEEEEVGLGLHDINLAWVFVGVKHKRQLCC